MGIRSHVACEDGIDSNKHRIARNTGDRARKRVLIILLDINRGCCWRKLVQRIDIPQVETRAIDTIRRIARQSGWEIALRQHRADTRGERSDCRIKRNGKPVRIREGVNRAGIAIRNTRLHIHKWTRCDIGNGDCRVRKIGTCVTTVQPDPRRVIVERRG